MVGMNTMGYKTLEEILTDYFACNKPFTKEGKLTKDGERAYRELNDLVDVLCLLCEEDERKFHAYLDEIVDGRIY